jgi:hypothetical protein
LLGETSQGLPETGSYWGLNIRYLLLCQHCSWTTISRYICYTSRGLKFAVEPIDALFLWGTCLRNFLCKCSIWGFYSDGYEEYHLLGCDAV